jgi:hypothetical protein
MDLYLPDYQANRARTRFRKALDFPLRFGEGASLADRLALEHAWKMQERDRHIQCAYPYVVDSSGDAVYTANASTAVETTQLTLSGTVGGQVSPSFPADFFSVPGQGIGRTACLEAWGYASVTGTPTLTFTVRIYTSALDVSTGAILAISPAITASSGISNKPWYLKLDMMCSIAGQGTGKGSLQCFCEIHMPLGGSATGFAGTTSQIFDATALSAPDQTAWVATFDPSLKQYLSINTTWSASSSSNTSTLKFWKMSTNY